MKHGAPVTYLALNCGASYLAGGRVSVINTSVDRCGAGVGGFGEMEVRKFSEKHANFFV